MPWRIDKNSSYTAAKHNLDSLLEEASRQTDLARIEDGLTDTIRQAAGERARLERVLATADYPSKKSVERIKRVNRLQGQVKTLQDIETLYVSSRLDIQKRLTRSQLDRNQLDAALSTVDRIWWSRGDSTALRISNDINRTTYELALDIIRECAKDPSGALSALSKALTIAVRARLLLDRVRVEKIVVADEDRITEEAEEQITEEAEQLSDIVADILVATNFPPPNKSKQFWKPRIVAALQAILYGIASSAIWELSYHMFSQMNPEAQHSAYMQIRNKSWEELTQREIPEEFEEIVGSKEFADSLFNSLFDISFHR